MTTAKLKTPIQNLTKDEDGQAHLFGFGICFPVVLIAVFFLVNLCWVGFQVVSLDHALYQSSWTMDAQKLNRAITTNQANQTIYDAIISDWTMLDKTQVVVSNAAISDVNASDNKELTATHDNEDLHIERIEQGVRSAHVRADVSYTIKTLFPLPGSTGIVIERHIDKTQLVNMRFEVS